VISAPRTGPPATRRHRLQRGALNLTFVVCLALANGCASNNRDLAPVDTLTTGERQQAPSNIRKIPPRSSADCSGLVYYAYRKVGLNVPRTTWAQYQGVKRVYPAGLRVGDLLFFRLSGRRVSHVGIYLGRNQFVHAPATGSRVSYARLTMPFWRQRFVGAGRLY
jgi:cell wall-associated NlpC family hydrolase